MTLPYRILVLDDDEHALAGVVELLRGMSYDAVGAATYESASALLASQGFDLFITDVRLRGFNGLHLVKRVRASFPQMAVIIISGYEEALMELEARRYQAMFVRKPLQPSTFLQTVAGSLAMVPRERRWPRTRVAGGFRVTAAGRVAVVMDVSHGGLRLEVPSDTRLPAAFEVDVSGIGLQIVVQTVWSGPSDTSQYTVCGAALVEGDTEAARTWRVIVDRLSA